MTLRTIQRIVRREKLWNGNRERVRNLWAHETPSTSKAAAAIVPDAGLADAVAVYAARFGTTNDLPEGSGGAEIMCPAVEEVGG